MRALHLELTLLSPLLTGSGEGDALIDADVVYNKWGVPFVPARRVKGLLRESLTETLEILDNETQANDVLDRLFGAEDTGTGSLYFGNLYPKGWKQMKEELPLANLPAESIRKHYTVDIPRTAMDEKGVARNKSLRNYRAIKPGVVFDAEITVAEIGGTDFELLKKAALNCRYAGTQRNRGMGKVAFRIDEKADDKGSTGPNNNETVVNGGTLLVAITTTSPAVLAKQLGDQNTVFTEKTISGNQLLGAMASSYIKLKELKHIAHKDAGFQEFFLSGKLRFSHLGLNGQFATPLNLQKEKGAKEGDENTNVFEDETKVTKPITDPIRHDGAGGFVSDKWPQTSFYFHGTRKNDRKAGRSTQEQDGGIFYYESIDEGQTFLGTISGESPLLEKLVNTFGNRFNIRLGKSKTAQYSEATVVLSTTKDTDVPKSAANVDGKYTLVAQSPLLLLNAWGSAEPTEETLIQYLAERLGISAEEIKVEKSATSISQVEQYNVQWRSKSGKMPAFAAGSTFQLKINGDIAEKLQNLSHEGLGEWTYQGFGKLLVIAGTEMALAKGSQQHGSTSNDTTKLTNETLIGIAKKLEQGEADLKVKIQAYTDALEQKQKQATTITNHLIGRLLLMLKAKGVDGVKKWVVTDRGKQAVESLRKAHLLDEKGELLNKYQGQPGLDKLYWETFFTVLRKKQ